MGTRASLASNAASTRERIMDAAEDLFIEHGYSATSLRAIASAADVNLAATHYHFGSKFGLLAEVFHRRIQPIDAARQAGLDALEAKPEKMTVRAIVEAFLTPVITAGDHDPQWLERLPRLIGRLFGEPESLTKPLLEAEFTDVAGRYQRALAAALGGAPADQVAWHFHFLVGGMIHLMRLQAPLGKTPSAASLRAGLQALINFSVAGFNQLKKDA